MDMKTRDSKDELVAEVARMSLLLSCASEVCEEDRTKNRDSSATKSEIQVPATPALNS
jgi:hypothetical protein